jgi:hypothetical protein
MSQLWMEQMQLANQSIFNLYYAFNKENVKVGDRVKIVKYIRSDSARKLLGQTGTIVKILSSHCCLDIENPEDESIWGEIRYGGIYYDEIQKIDNNWDY